MGKDKKLKKALKQELSNPKFKINIVAVDKSPTKNGTQSQNSFIVSDKLPNGDKKNYCITIIKEDVNNISTTPLPKRRRRRIFIRELINMKTKKRRLDVSTSNWLPKAAKPVFVDVATSPVHEKSDNRILDNLIKNMKNTPCEITPSYPNTCFSNREITTIDLDDDIMELLRSTPLAGPSASRVTPIFDSIQYADPGEFNFSNFNDSSYPELLLLN